MRYWKSRIKDLVGDRGYCIDKILLIKELLIVHDIRCCIVLIWTCQIKDSGLYYVRSALQKLIPFHPGDIHTVGH